MSQSHWKQLVTPSPWPLVIADRSFKFTSGLTICVRSFIFSHTFMFGILRNDQKMRKQLFIRFCRNFSFSNFKKGLNSLENYFLFNILTGTFIEKVFFNFLFFFYKPKFYFKLFYYNLNYNKIIKFSLSLYYHVNKKISNKPTTNYLSHWYHNNLHFETMPYYFNFYSYEEKLYFNNLIIVSLNLLEMRELVVVLWENSNKLVIPKKITMFLSNSNLLHGVDEDYNIINYFDSPNKKYFFKKNILALEKEYGPSVSTYVFCQYLGYFYEIYDETLKFNVIDLGDFFYTKQSIAYFITFCFTSNIKNKQFFNNLFFIYNQLVPTKNETYFLKNTFSFVCLCSILFMYQQQQFALNTGLGLSPRIISNLTLLELFPKILKLKELNILTNLSNKTLLNYSMLLHSSRLNDQYIFEKSLGRIGYFSQKSHQDLAIIYASLIKKLKPTINQDSLSQLIIRDPGKSGWFSAEIANMSLIHLDNTPQVISDLSKTFEYQILYQHKLSFIEIKNWGANYSSIEKIVSAYDEEQLKAGKNNVILIFNIDAKPIPVNLQLQLELQIKLRGLQNNIFFISPTSRNYTINLALEEAVKPYMTIREQAYQNFVDSLTKKNKNLLNDKLALGDRQNLEKDLSSFIAHLPEVTSNLETESQLITKKN